jgi:glycosyltransferase involved in cell wall biosynthesis
VKTVSVIIPSYNHAHFVDAAVCSALAQTYPNVEIIVVDDGSVDNTAEVVAGFGTAVTYIWQPNQGLSAARNTGIRASQGEHIALLDADDLWLPAFLAEAVAAIEKSPQVGLVYTWWSHIDEHGKPMPEPGHFNQRGNLLMALALKNYFPPVSVLFRKQGAEAAGYFDEKLFALEDWDLWLRLSADGWEIDYVPQVLAQYRRHSNNMTLDVPRMERNQLLVLDKLSRSAIAPKVAHLLPQARATVYLNSALSYHSQAKLTESYQSFVTAVQTWPDLLLQEETWYRWICADQPPGYQDTSYFKNLPEAEVRNERLLARLMADSAVAPLLRGQQKEIERIAHLMLARHFYTENDMRGARRQLLTLSRRHPTTLLRPGNAGLFLKTFLGHQRIAAWRHRLASGNQQDFPPILGS